MTQVTTKQNMRQNDVNISWLTWNTWHFSGRKKKSFSLPNGSVLVPASSLLSVAGKDTAHRAIEVVGTFLARDSWKKVLLDPVELWHAIRMKAQDCQVQRLCCPTSVQHLQCEGQAMVVMALRGYKIVWSYQNMQRIQTCIQLSSRQQNMSPTFGGSPHSRWLGIEPLFMASRSICVHSIEVYACAGGQWQNLVGILCGAGACIDWVCSQETT